MGRYRVTTPVADYFGALGDLVFTRGEALANDEDHAAELAYARSRGYGIEPYDRPTVEPAESDTDEDGMPKKSASTEVWRQYAAGVGDLTDDQIADMSRDQLVAHYASKENDR